MLSWGLDVVGVGRRLHVLEREPDGELRHLLRRKPVRHRSAS